MCNFILDWNQGLTNLEFDTEDQVLYSVILYVDTLDNDTQLSCVQILLVNRIQLSRVHILSDNTIQLSCLQILLDNNIMFLEISHKIKQ